jgi:hypothetical protein
MPTLTRTETPNGGWQFYQPETNWSLPDPMNHSWDTAVLAIMKHRQANPVLRSRAGQIEVQNDLEAFTLARLPKKTKSLIAPNETPVRKCRSCGGR